MNVVISNNEDDGYEEIEQLILSRLPEVRSILNDKHNFTVPENCDAFLMRCLRLKDGNVDKAVKLIIAFRAAITDMLGWDSKLQPSAYKEFYDAGMIIQLRKRDPSNRRIYIMRMSQWDPKKTSFDEVMTCIWMMAQHSNAEFIDVQRQGTVTIWDFSQFSLQQAWAVKQWRLPSIAKMALNGIGGKVKEFHVINHPRIVNVLYAGIKHFLNEKLKKRIFFHAGAQSLIDHLGAESLPDYLGGSLNSDKCIDTDFLQILLNDDNYFKEMENNRLPIR